MYKSVSREEEHTTTIPVESDARFTHSTPNPVNNAAMLPSPRTFIDSFRAAAPSLPWRLLWCTIHLSAVKMVELPREHRAVSRLSSPWPRNTMKLMASASLCKFQISKDIVTQPLISTVMSSKARIYWGYFRTSGTVIDRTGHATRRICSRVPTFHLTVRLDWHSSARSVNLELLMVSNG